MNNQNNLPGYPSKNLLLNIILFGSLALILILNALIFFLISSHLLTHVYYLITAMSLINIFYVLSFIFLFNLQLKKNTSMTHQKKLLDNQLKEITEAVPEGIASLNTLNQYTMFNIAYQNEFRKLFGKIISIGMTLEESLQDSPQYKEKLITNWQRALTGEKFVEIIELDKEVYELSATPIVNGNKQLIGATHVIRNITKRIEQDKEMSELNEKLAYEMQELGIHNEKMTLLIELSDIVQACFSIKEATKAIAIKCRRILHFAEGTLYIMDSTTNALELAVTWGDPVGNEKSISADQCWALRRGGIYQVKNPQTDLICEHVIEKKAIPYMCIPLMAQNSIFGLLHLDLPDNFSLSDENKLLISAITETLSLSLSNIKLRETLRNQSLHDSLTGLYNRRYLDEFLLKEINFARRNQTYLAIVMIDIDHFKQFNDKYGHEAGDLILQELGKVFQTEIRASDITCRYGGEEFLCVLHDCTLDDAKRRIEDLRNKISTISLLVHDQKLERITISSGIAIYPDNGSTIPELIEAADKALYHAKNTGRNKVIAYSETNPPAS